MYFFSKHCIQSIQPIPNIGKYCILGFSGVFTWYYYAGPVFFAFSELRYLSSILKIDLGLGRLFLSPSMGLGICRQTTDCIEFRFGGWTHVSCPRLCRLTTDRIDSISHVLSGWTIFENPINFLFRPDEFLSFPGSDYLNEHRSGTFIHSCLLPQVLVLWPMSSTIGKYPTAPFCASFEVDVFLNYLFLAVTPLKWWGLSDFFFA